VAHPGEVGGLMSLTEEMLMPGSFGIWTSELYAVVMVPDTPPCLRPFPLMVQLLSATSLLRGQRTIESIDVFLTHLFSPANRTAPGTKDGGDPVSQTRLPYHRH